MFVERLMDQTREK